MVLLCRWKYVEAIRSTSHDVHPLQAQHLHLGLTGCVPTAAASRAKPPPSPISANVSQLKVSDASDSLHPTATHGGDRNAVTTKPSPDVREDARPAIAVKPKNMGRGLHNAPPKTLHDETPPAPSASPQQARQPAGPVVPPAKPVLAVKPKFESSSAAPAPAQQENPTPVVACNFDSRSAAVTGESVDGENGDARTTLQPLPQPPASLPVSPRSNVPALPHEEEQMIQRLLTMSAWAKPRFEAEMKKIVDKLNSGLPPCNIIGVPKELAENYTLRFQQLKLKEKYGGGHAHLRIGEIKTLHRCREKTLVDYLASAEHPARPASRYLVDTLRCTFTFEDPVALAVGFWLLHSIPHCRVVRVKNKLIDETEPAETRTVILVNLEMAQLCVLGTLIVEVQLTFQGFNDVKKAQHPLYKFIRLKENTPVTSQPALDTLLQPAFKLKRTPEESERSTSNPARLNFTCQSEVDREIERMDKVERALCVELGRAESESEGAFGGVSELRQKKRAVDDILEELRKIIID